MQKRRTLWWFLLGLILVAVLGMMTTSVLGAAAGQPSAKIAVSRKGLPDMSSVTVPQGVPLLAALFGLKRPTAILLSHAGDTWYAFSNRSTHLGEQVFPFPDKGVFMDPYAGTVYDRTGRDIAGPAPRGLDSYPVTVDGDYLIIDLSRPQLGR